MRSCSSASSYAAMDHPPIQEPRHSECMQLQRHASKLLRKPSMFLLASSVTSPLPGQFQYLFPAFFKNHMFQPPLKNMLCTTKELVPRSRVSQCVNYRLFWLLPKEAIQVLWSASKSSTTSCFQQTGPAVSRSATHWPSLPYISKQVKRFSADRGHTNWFVDAAVIYELCKVFGRQWAERVHLQATSIQITVILLCDFVLNVDICVYNSFFSDQRNR